MKKPRTQKAWITFGALHMFATSVSALSLFFHPNTPVNQFLYTGYLILLYTLTCVYGFSTAIGKYEETYKWPLYIKLRKSV